MSAELIVRFRNTDDGQSARFGGFSGRFLRVRARPSNTSSTPQEKLPDANPPLNPLNRPNPNQHPQGELRRWTSNYTPRTTESLGASGLLLGLEPEDVNEIRQEFEVLDTLVCVSHAHHPGEYMDDKNLVANAIDRLTLALLYIEHRREASAQADSTEAPQRQRGRSQ